MLLFLLFKCARHMTMNTICLGRIEIIASSFNSYLFPFVDKLEEATFVETQMGNPMLLDRNGQGFLIEKKFKKVNGGVRIYWHCREYKKQRKCGQETCPARATTDGIYVKSWKFEHNHPLKHSPYIE